MEYAINIEIEPIVANAPKYGKISLNVYPFRKIPLSTINM
jgi:hypothetical protein